MKGVFVTGTDTGVGKTFASCVLIHAIAAHRLKVLPMKPVAAGSDEDTVALMRAARADASLRGDVTPVLLREAIAPHIAAVHERVRIAIPPIIDAFRRLASRGDFIVVEGVGGFSVPLDDATDTIDLAKALALPVVLVVGLRLGCLNHALLTARAIQGAGLPFAGWIANEIDPAMAALDANVATLHARLPAPLLGRLAHAPGAEPSSLAKQLDVRTLVAAR